MSGEDLGEGGEGGEREKRGGERGEGEGGGEGEREREREGVKYRHRLRPLRSLTTERPSFTFSMTFQTCRLDAGSRPVVGSSRMRMSGLPMHAMATERRRLIPPDNALDLRLRAS